MVIIELAAVTEKIANHANENKPYLTKSITLTGAAHAR